MSRAYLAGVVLALVGGCGLVLLGLWLATHPEAGASLELVRALVLPGVALASLAASAMVFPRGAA